MRRRSVVHPRLRSSANQRVDSTNSYKTRIVKVIGYDSLNAEVFLYDSDGSVEGHSSTLNTEIPVMSSGSHTIQIQGDGWYAEGEIDVE